MSSPGPIVGIAELEPAVKVHLRGGTAGPGQPGLPEVLRSRQRHDPLLGNPTRLPDLDRFLIRAQAELLVAAEHGHPDPLGIEPEDVDRELQAPGDRLVLEVVAEAPVSEHLEEGQVAAGVPHLLDVGRAEALLARGDPLARRRLVAAKVGLEGLHPGDRQQRRGVLGGRDQRRRGHAQVPSLLEKRQVGLAELAGVHGVPQSRRRSSRARRPARRPSGRRSGRGRRRRRARPAPGTAPGAGRRAASTAQPIGRER